MVYRWSEKKSKKIADMSNEVDAQQKVNAVAWQDVDRTSQRAGRGSESDSGE
jgi:hypothetical protein